MSLRGDSEAMTVTVRKSDLLRILTNNKQKHVEEFEQACAVYKKKVAEEYSAFRSQIAEFLHEWDAATRWESLPRFPEMVSRLPKPESFAAHYTRAIGMLELHAKDEMTLDMAAYRRYIEDDWEWSSRAKAVRDSYLVGR